MSLKLAHFMSHAKCNLTSKASKIGMIFNLQKPGGWMPSWGAVEVNLGAKKRSSVRPKVGQFLGLLLVCSATAQAGVVREDIGELKIHDLLLRPSFTLSEPKSGAFSIGESSFALRWELEEKFSGVIRIGPRTLLNPAARYADTVPDDVTLVEAFAEYVDHYGRFRLGRLPVEFGYEGRQWERSLIFPRSLLFQKRMMMLRDVGGAYEVNHNNFYTGFVVHNGESDADRDGQIWYSAHWGYRTEIFEVGMAGQTGHTRPAGTSTSNDNLGGVDETRDATWRVGGLYTVWGRKGWEWVLEVYGGEVEQLTKVVGNFYAGHTDFSYEWTKHFSTHLRWDQMDPNTRLGGDGEQAASLALVFSNGTRSSNLIVVASKKLEQGHEIANDEIRLIWNLSPSGVVRF